MGLMDGVYGISLPTNFRAVTSPYGLQTYIMIQSILVPLEIIDIS